MAKVKEIWKDIEGYEGYYQISNRARVRGLPGQRHRSNVKGRVMKQTKGSSGYMYVALWNKYGKRKNCTVHRLLMMTFIPNPHNKKEVNHLNVIRSDNRLENLEWCTRKENMQHSAQLGRIGKNDKRGEKHPGAILTNVDVLNIRALGASPNKPTYPQLAMVFGVNRRTIGYIITRKLWKHI